MVRTRVPTWAGVAVAVLFLATAANAGVLIGSVGGPTNSGSSAGAIVSINESTGVATILGTPISGTGITGLAVDGSGRLLGSTSNANGGPRLIEINPFTGGLASVIATLTLGGSPQAVTDLAYDPVSGVLFANGADTNGNLYSVNMTTGALTLVGVMDTPGGFKALATAPDGTLYSLGTNSGNRLDTLNKLTAATLTSTTAGSSSGALGMAVRPSDGMIFFMEGSSAPYGRDLWTMDPNTAGSAALVGSSGLNANIHDLVFISAVPEPSTLALFGLGALGLVLHRRRRRARA